jgi:hypothetical protein
MTADRLAARIAGTAGAASMAVIAGSTAGSSPSCCASRATAGGGAARTSSGTNPSHGNVASATASLSLSAGPPPRRGSRNATSAGAA